MMESMSLAEFLERKQHSMAQRSCPNPGTKKTDFLGRVLIVCVCVCVHVIVCVCVRKCVDV